MRKSGVNFAVAILRVTGVGGWAVGAGSSAALGRLACEFADVRERVECPHVRPVRAGLVSNADAYRWSSAVAHLTGQDEFGLIDMRWWKTAGVKGEWQELVGCDHSAQEAALRASTYAGRPFGDEAFLAAFSDRFDRHWKRGRPRKDAVKVGSS